MKFSVILFLFFGSVAQAEIKILFTKEKWIELRFNNYPPNKVEYAADNIRVNVDSSASPLVYKLDQAVDVNNFEVNLSIKGNLPESDEFEEDSYFRLGFVVLGDNQLGTLGRMFAPQWAQELFKLAPEGSGLDKIYFYNVAQSKNHLNKERINPLSKYMYEKVIAVKDTENKEIKYTLPKSLKTIALWLSIEGDSTKSKFTTDIKSIKLNSL